MGASPLVVTAVGRWTAPGNSQVHIVKFVDATTLTVVASAQVATAGMPSGQFAYANLASPVTLAAGARYYLLSQEFGGGDVALLSPTNVVTTTVAKIDGSAWQDSGGSYNYDGDNPNAEREALDFKYQTGDGTAAIPMSVMFNPPAPVVANNSASGTSVTAINVTMSDGSQFAGTLNASPSSLVAISGSQLMLSRAVTPADDGAHTCSVTATDNGSSVTGNVMMQVAAISPPPPPAPPPALTIRGTPYEYQPANSGGFNMATSASGGTVVSGTVTLQSRGAWLYGGAPPVGTLTYQWYLDGKPISPQIQDSRNTGTEVSPPFTYQWDSTKFLDGSAVTDGSHILHGVFIDYTTFTAYNLRPFAMPLLVYNHGSVPATPSSQIVAVTGAPNGLARVWPPSWPDFVTYPGSPVNPQNTQQAWPYKFNPPQTLGNIASGSKLIIESITGPRTYEYSTNPWWATTPLGGVYVLQMNVENGDPAQTAEGAYVAQLADCYADGGRCNNEVSWATTYVEAPDGSAWYGVEVSGRLFRLDHNGTVTTIAGVTKDWSKLKFDADLRASRGGPLSESDYKSRMTFVGNNSVGDHDLGTATDLAFDPLDTTHRTIFIVKQADSCIVKVDMSTSPATITLFAGQDGNPGYADGVLTSAQFDNPTSIAIASDDGTMYIADTNNCVIRKISPTRTTVTTFLGSPVARPTRDQVATSPAIYSPITTLAFSDPSLVLPYPFTIRLNSTGDIVLYENTTLHLRRIWLSGTNADHVTSIGFWGSTNGAPLFSARTDGWSWIDVDTAGVLGRIDDIIAAQWDSGDGTAENYWRFSIDGSVSFGDGGGEPIGQCSGNPVGFDDGWGHYPWAIAISKFKSRFICSGIANNGAVVVRAAQPGDVLLDPNSPDGSYLNSRALLSGQYIYATGTVSGRGANAYGFPNSYTGTPVTNVFPWNIRPSFWGIRGNGGGGHLGIFNDGGVDKNSFDALNAAFPSISPGDAGDQALAGYIQSGFGGSVPRPEITGNDMRDLIYFIRYNTTAGSVGTGSPKVPVQAGPDHPDTGYYPTITSISATRVDATTITVNWQTNKPTIGFAAAGAQSQVGQRDPYPVWSEIEKLTPSTYALNHSATISNCLAGALMHYTAVAKDVAGNSVYASDQVMPAYTSPDGSAITNGVGSLYNGYGTWTFGPQNAPPGGSANLPYYYILLNGRPIDYDVQQLQMNFGGNMFVLGRDDNWMAFTGYNASTFVSSPTLIPPAPPLPPPPTVFNPPYTRSPDGSVISGGVGSVVTADGVWTFGSARGSGWDVVLNGTPVTSGIPAGGVPAVRMEINSHGNLFAQSAGNSQWYVYLGFAWWLASSSVPPGPIPINVNCATPLVTTITTTTPLNTVVSAVNVVMSDGSPFTGSLSVDPQGNPNYLGISGSNVVLIAHPSAGFAGFFRIMASQNGVESGSGISVIDLVVSR